MTIIESGMKRIFLLCFLAAPFAGLALRARALAAPSQGNPVFYHGWWQGNLIRSDGQNIIFNFLVKDSAGKTVLYVRNARERLLVDDVRISGDSVHIRMPFFESSFRARILEDGHLEGVYVRKGTVGEHTQPFAAYPDKEQRFALSQGNAKVQVTGRYAARFISPQGTTIDTAVAEFYQKGNDVTGTFLTPTGDYRFLEGIVTGDSLKVSTFDGSHAFVFTAKVGTGHTLQGAIYASDAPSSRWEGAWNPQASWPAGMAEAHLVNKDSSRFHFRFPDTDSNMVSISDPRFRGKVVIIQIMGSWCPNCMDETQFLSAYYDKNKSRGIEIVGVAYERSTDFQRSRQGLATFQKRFHVQYPMLITGVTVGDPEKARKTLPELDAIKSYPTTLILDKKGNLRRVHAGFEGPGTGMHYAEFQKNFNDWVDELLAE